jgi:purine-binding chemotaxis protein CheW
VTRLLIVVVAGERYALPALQVSAVLRAEQVTPVPLVGPEILGILHVRGKTLGLVHLARLLDPAASPPGPAPIAVVVETDFDSYAVVVDDVDEVIEVASQDRLETPSHGDPRRAALTDCFFRIDGNVLALLDVNRLFEPVSDGGVQPMPAASRGALT